MIYRILLLFVLGLFAVGCSTNPAVHGGQTLLSFNSKTGDFELANTKEYAEVFASIKPDEDGIKEFTYSAKGVEAFEGQAITAQVQAMLAEQRTEMFNILPDILANAFSKALRAYLGGSALEGAGRLLSPDLSNLPNVPTQ